MSVDILIYGAVVVGMALLWVGVVIGLSKRHKSAVGGISRLEEAMMKSKDDPIEPARFVP
jgi:hypothetical protein